MAVATLTMTVQRSKVVDFPAYPHSIDYIDAVYRLPDPDSHSTFSLFFQPFKPRVWLSILVALPVGALTISLVSRAGSKCRTKMQRRRQMALSEWTHALWLCLGANMAQGEQNYSFCTLYILRTGI